MRYRAETSSELIALIRVILVEIPRERSFSRMDGVIAKMRAGRW
jgi:hypothetical protein